MLLESKSLRWFMDINDRAWRMVLSAGFACGWMPAGTSWPPHFHGRDMVLWPRNYFDQVCQRFMPDDAQRFAVALDEAARCMEAGDPGLLIAMQPWFIPSAQGGGSPPIRPLSELRGYAPRLRQIAAFFREATADGSPVLLVPPIGTMLGTGTVVVTPKGTEFRRA